MFLRDLVVIILCSLLFGLVASSFGFTTFVGFVASGMLVGPSCLDLIHHVQYIESLAQAGVSLLLFESGVHFNREAAKHAYRLTSWTFLVQVLLLGSCTTSTLRHRHRIHYSNAPSLVAKHSVILTLSSQCALPDPMMICMSGSALPGLYATFGFRVSFSEMSLLCLCLALSSSTVTAEMAQESSAIDPVSLRVAISILAGQDLFMGFLLCLPVCTNARGRHHTLTISTARQEAFFHGALGVFIVLKQIIYGALLTVVALAVSSRFMPRFVGHFLNRTSSKLYLLALRSLCSCAAIVSSLVTTAFKWHSSLS